MIYMKIRINLLQEGLRKVNEFIDSFENLPDTESIDWYPDKATILFKLGDRSWVTLVEKEIMDRFQYVRWYIFDEEAKTETINHMDAGKLTGEYKLPLFPEDYKF